MPGDTTKVTKTNFYSGDKCLLMFSGGRDFTLAALRLNLAGSSLVLVTITSDHLHGIERVRRRLLELSRLLPLETRWIRVRQPSELLTDISFYEPTCLPCHHAYVVVSGVLARSMVLRRLAFGYVGYQASWPEQTEFATSRLRAVLATHKISLELPVYDITSRDAAIAELALNGLSTEALEQKCSHQVTNVSLAQDRLRQQVDLWENAINRSMAAIDDIAIEVLDDTTLGNIAA